jgi:lysophospholipase L1-like esterase
MTLFTALGDSITLGVGDPVKDADGRRWRGWTRLLADTLPDPELHILAGNGACMADVERDQLPRALECRPDVASVVFGVNDTLRSNFNPDRIAAGADHVVGSLRASGAQVLTMRLPDPGQMLGVPGAIARPLARRAHLINEVMDEIAARYGTLHYDAARDEEAAEKRMWAADRLHPNERGHRLIARRFHAQLTETGLLLADPPGAEPQNPPPSKLAVVGWMATKGTAWVVKRSTDLVPHLLAMAAKEMLSERREKELSETR